MTLKRLACPCRVAESRRAQRLTMSALPSHVLRRARSYSREYDYLITPCLSAAYYGGMRAAEPVRGGGMSTQPHQLKARTTPERN